MGFGFGLAALGMIVTGIVMLAYVAKMRSNRSEMHHVTEQVGAVVALMLGVAAFFLQPGIGGALLAVVAIVPSGLFLISLRLSREPDQAPNMVIGQHAPEIKGVAADGTRFRLSHLRGHPVLLKFYRGFWCQHCLAELKELASLAGEFEQLGVQLVAVSADDEAETKRFAAKRRFPIQLVSDPDLEGHKAYNVHHRKFTPTRGPFRELAIPTTVLIGADGKVLWYVQSKDHRVRPHADWVLGMIAPFVQK
ncbi:MAG TPA: redoxin domain-containing protein, partial [Caulobacteraceae bacterium]|nr:redoxin domain-containing protein [Caulobacteraceae bacterium]